MSYPTPFDAHSAQALARRFPSGFTWGVATSAYQIEGAAREDGRADSIWDEFCRRPGVIRDGSSGDRACDHYHRLESDLNLIASLGVRAYRFSVSWPRVQPRGRGAWNEAGFAFYRRLVDGLRERGIEPHLTLYHWDLPLALQLRGGWTSRETVSAFAAYAREVVRRLGRDLASIATHNEPWVVATLGHEVGSFAPGIKNRRMAMQAAHHLLLSHGAAMHALRAAGCKCPIGIVLNQSPIHTASDSAADRAKARLDDGLLVRWYMDALMLGTYPADVLEHLGSDAPVVENGDMETISQALDFLGVNYYTRTVVNLAGLPADEHTRRPVTDMGWEVFPEGLTELLLRLRADYRVPPLYVMENGAAYGEEPVDGRVADLDRIAYLRSHIAAVADAREAGVDVRGYFVWSLLDNFEWADGYSKRFGIVHVDYATEQRTIKDSGLWYRQFLRSEHT